MYTVEAIMVEVTMTGAQNFINFAFVSLDEISLVGFRKGFEMATYLARAMMIRKSIDEYMEHLIPECTIVY